MSRLDQLNAAIETDRRHVAVYEAVPDVNKSNEQWRRYAIDLRTLVKNVLERDALITAGTVTGDTGTGGTTTEPSPPVVVPGDAAAKSRAWNRLEATDNIKAVYQRSGLGDTATKEERRAALGDGLYAQAIALGQFGSPYWGPGDADTPLTPEEYAVGDIAGGYWGRRSGLDNKLTPGFYQRIFNASKLVAEKLTPSYMSSEDAHALALANGLNEAEDGPA